MSGTVPGRGVIGVRRVATTERELAGPIAEVINRAYAPAISELWTISFDRVAEADVVDAIAAGEIVVAELDTRIVGSVRVRRVDTDTSWFGVLAVHPSVAGVGVARDLLDYIEEEALADGAGYMELDLLIPSDATSHQARLQRWYERRGYVEVSRTDFAPSDPAIADGLRSTCVSIVHRKILAA